MSCLQNVGYVFGDSTKGQRAVYEMGHTGIPVVNCNNNCATGHYIPLMCRVWYACMCVSLQGAQHCISVDN